MKKRAGFTLIEIMVVIAILAITAIMALPAYIYSQNRAKVDNVASGVVSTVNNIRSLAVSGWGVLDPSETAAVGGATAAQVQLAKSLVLNFDKANNKITAFADLDGDAKFTAKDVDLTDLITKDESLVLNKITLSDGAEYQNFELAVAVPDGQITILTTDGAGELYQYPFAKIATAIDADETDTNMVRAVLIKSTGSYAYTCTKDTADDLCLDTLKETDKVTGKKYTTESVVDFNTSVNFAKHDVTKTTGAPTPPADPDAAAKAQMTADCTACGGDMISVCGYTYPAGTGCGYPAPATLSCMASRGYATSWVGGCGYTYLAGYSHL